MGFEEGCYIKNINDSERTRYADQTIIVVTMI